MHVRRVQPLRAGFPLGREGTGPGPVDLRSPRPADEPHIDVRQLPGPRLRIRCTGDARCQGSAGKTHWTATPCAGPDRVRRSEGAVRGQRLLDPGWYGGAARTMGCRGAEGPERG